MPPSNRRCPQIDAALRSSVKKINAAAFNRGNTVCMKINNFWFLHVPHPVVLIFCVIFTIITQSSMV